MERLRVWECCGHRWELLLSRLYPERDDWEPKCQTCGKTALLVVRYSRRTMELGFVEGTLNANTT